MVRGEAVVKVAYFSMEIGLDPSLPTYAGGLGVLAGDTLKSAADLGAPMLGITLLHRKGYFRQQLDASGNQSEEPVEWNPEELLEPLSERATVAIERRDLVVRAWRYVLTGIDGDEVPVYFLDTDLPENTPQGRALTDHLYGGDDRYRLCQEAILGIGGVAMLRALGYVDIETYHMNEGHSSLLVLALGEEEAGESGPTAAAPRLEVRSDCVFTTHTPVPAGHDRFPLALVHQVLGEQRAQQLVAAGCCPQESLNMTSLAMRSSRYVNGVAMRHGEVSRGMFPNYPIRSITNGVHVATWTSAPFRELFDRYIPEWRSDNLQLRYAVGIPLPDVEEAHARAKRELLAEVANRTGVALEPDVLTIGFARRATPYKRAELLFSDVGRLRRLVTKIGKVQVLMAGKAHPRDEAGQAIIRNIHQAAAELKGDLQLLYLENYDMQLATFLCSGVDVWLNTPERPREASGTSGMKAALNGVPSLSVLDGWWVEGHVEGVTGWSIGEAGETPEEAAADSSALYEKLEQVVVPMYYTRRTSFTQVRRSCVALNGSFFNTHRMVLQYLRDAYRVPGSPS